MNRANLWWLLLLTLVSVLYFPLNRPWGTVHHVALSLDAHIPFVPVFVIPYLLFIPYQTVTLFYAACFKRRFEPIALAFLLTWLISYGCYLVFQTTVMRPSIEPNGFLLYLIYIVYGKDAPYNCLPSLHSAGATLCACSLIHLNPKTKIGALPFSAAIVLSTLFIKQHYILDAVTGVSLGGGAFYLAHRYDARTPRRP